MLVFFLIYIYIYIIKIKIEVLTNSNMGGKIDLVLTQIITKNISYYFYYLIKNNVVFFKEIIIVLSFKSYKFEIRQSEVTL